LLAPVAAGDKVGTVHLYLDGKVVAEQPLQAANDVKPVTSMWRKAADSIFIMVFGR
jgi:D-alanyl-D-alanine carboxypeptidase